MLKRINTAFNFRNLNLASDELSLSLHPYIKAALMEALEGRHLDGHMDADEAVVMVGRCKA